MPLSSAELKKFREASREASKIGGAVLLKFLGTAKVSEKKPRDFVTEADIASQAAIKKFLLDQFPEHEFLGEESDPADIEHAAEGRFCWIVDPLDGTTNYVHQLRSFSVSVALRFGDQIVAGSVYDPVLDECYSAALDQGADLNGESIKPSDCTELDKALAICSFSSSVTREHPEVERFLRVLGTVGSIRRLGSAALNLCNVAGGRGDTYWATGLSCWDIAAGWLILSEAGGTMLPIEGEHIDLMRPKFCAAATPELFEKMQQLLKV